MARISYVDGRFLPSREATVAMEDRGYQFADGVYEVAAFMNQRLLDEARHLDRLERSLAAVAIPLPMTRRALTLKLYELMRRSRQRDGLLYLQITRGAAPRNHLWSNTMRPILTMSVFPAKFPSGVLREKGCAVITAPDERWARCDIKSIALLPNVLARKKSASPDLRETWLVNDAGVITEGSSTNVFIVTKSGRIITHPADHHILGGVTRDVALEIARDHQIPAEERGFTREEMAQASEAFLTSTSNFVLPVVTIDGKAVGDGKPGPVTRRLMALYDEHIEQETDAHAA
ncbi:MAG: D-amino-acid transaminase [Alphaproteobacteria bacterium]|jgi:D-alanine transaminase